VEWAEEDEDFSEEIQDCEWMQQISKLEETIWTGNESSKMGLILQNLVIRRMFNQFVYGDEVPSASGEIMVDLML
jgi:hypothetical protein